MSKAAAFLRRAMDALPAGASVLDAGCGDFRMLREHQAELSGKHYLGCDLVERTAPANAQFVQCDLQSFPLPFEDDRFDLVILSHVLEHVADPVSLMGELVRVLKPGGQLFVECPSERSLRSGWWAPQHYNLILSFHDDPTHTGRPWSPQSLRRLALYLQSEPVLVGYDRSLIRRLRLPFDWLYGLVASKPDHMVSSWWLATGWVAYALVRKPVGVRGRPEFNYYSFKGLPPGPAYRP
jgi:SAM-dependent methyltransferase